MSEIPTLPYLILGAWVNFISNMVKSNKINFKYTDIKEYLERYHINQSDIMQIIVLAFPDNEDVIMYGTKCNG